MDFDDVALDIALDSRVSTLGAHRRSRGPAADIEDDSPPDRASPENIDTSAEGLLLHLVYRDAAGCESERTVSLIGVRRGDDGVAIFDCNCRLRHARRCFRTDRIITLANGRTGEIIVDPTAFAATFAETTPSRRRRLFLGWTTAETKRARARARPLAILMMAVARSDATLHTEELKALSAMVGEIVAPLGLPDDRHARAALVAELSALAPSGNLVTRACRSIFEAPDQFSAAPAWLGRMAMADGRLAEEEAQIFRGINARLARLAEELG